MAALPNLQFVVAKIDRGVDKLLGGQEIILDEIRKLQKLGERLAVSAQIKPQDAFTQYSGATEANIRQAIAQFKNLPNHLDFPQAALHAGSLFSALGDSNAAERFFIDIYNRTQKPKYQAIACFNLFLLYVQRGPAFYDKALKSLTEAIRLNRPAHVLHNVDRYPIHRLLGAGGMGCVFLCHDTLEEERLQKQQFVVVKCLWENQPGEPKPIFAEALSMARIAGDSVPKPLDYGFADPTQQQRAYFVFEVKVFASLQL
ncbi:MAG: hypothetical protein DRR19_05905 [Candidatus Parabeggiatoa sp. nov. 1]|nr:MAG: hypothetical protein DRR19_05905 [Gammaproteobacteria bacterium]